MTTGLPDETTIDAASHTVRLLRILQHELDAQYAGAASDQQREDIALKRRDIAARLLAAERLGRTPSAPN